MTNAIERAVTNTIDGTDAISSTIRSVSTLSNEALFALALLMLNVVIKKMPNIPNDYIPAITAVTGPLFYCSLAGWNGHNAIVGMVCGSASVHAHSIAKPFLKRYLGIPTGDTGQLTKPKTDSTNF